MIDQTVIGDSLWVLARSLVVEGSTCCREFLEAYVHGGTVVNPHNRLRTHTEDIHIGNFLRVNLASPRSASLPRDYIFATMPQFPWYRYPKKANELTFGEIYHDLYQQAANTGHAFTCRFTQSMIDPGSIDQIQAWLPSKSQPRPSCLGDFPKLMGQRVSNVSNLTSLQVHLTTIVNVREYSCHPEPGWVFDALESSMRLFQERWTESHIGGELSKFGNYPSTSQTLEYSEALRYGWRNLDPRTTFHVRENANFTSLRYGPRLEFVEYDCVQNIYSLDELDTEEKNIDADHVSLLEQTHRILDHMWCAENPMTIDEQQRLEWRGFRRDMRACWSAPLLRTMLLLAAMITCRIPLSAAEWVNRLFVPIYAQYGHAQYGGTFTTLGLLAKHARQQETKRDVRKRMYSVGQHLPEETTPTRRRRYGRDLFLVDPNTKVPVGLLPHFLSASCSDEHYVKMMNLKYADLIENHEGNRVATMMVPLRDLTDSVGVSRYKI